MFAVCVALLLPHFKGNVLESSSRKRKLKNAVIRKSIGLSCNDLQVFHAYSYNDSNHCYHFGNCVQSH